VWKRSMVRLLRHRQTKGPDSARSYLNRRATPRLHRFDRWSLSAMGMLQQSRKAEYSTGMRRTVLPLLLLLFAIVLAAQTASDLAIRYGDPDIDDACEPDHRF